MSETVLPVGRLLAIKDFDPLSIDVSAIQALAKEVPEDGRIELTEAEELSIKFLYGAELCSDLLSVLVRYILYKEGSVSARKAESFGKMNEEGVKVTVQIHQYASDTAYKEAVMSLADAKGVKDWLQRKHDNLVRAHYFCKDLVSNYNQDLRMSGAQ